jgi:SET domain-containing protein
MTRSKYPKVKVKRSSAGLGLFAATDIKKDRLIIEYTGERISSEEADRRGGRYLFTVTKKVVIDGKGRKNIARYINHACNPNAEAEHDEDTDRIFIRAIKNIQEGDEITYDYGEEYVDDFIKPHGCKCRTCSKKTKKQRL